MELHNGCKKFLTEGRALLKRCISILLVTTVLYSVQLYQICHILYLLSRTSAEAHSAVILPLWLSSLSSLITVHIISIFVHSKQCQESYLTHIKSKSSLPFGLRSSDTSCCRGNMQSYVHEHCAKSACWTNHKAWRVYMTMFHIAEFMPNHLCMNHIRWKDALQEQDRVLFCSFL